MRHAAQRVHDLVILALEDRLSQFQLGYFLAIADLDFGARPQLPDRRQHRAFFESLEIFVLLHHLVDHVHDPGADRLHQHLRALALQEVEHVEVAVALGGLRPELAGDLHDGFHAQPVDIHFIEPVAAALQRPHVIVTLKLVDELADVLRRIGEAAQVFAEPVFEFPRPLLAEHLVQVVHGLVEDAVGLARVHLVRPQRVSDFVHHIAAVQRIQNPEEEIDIHFQPGFGVGLA